MTKDEWTIYHISKLPPRVRGFAKAHWEFLQGRGNQPDYREYGISYKDAQTAIIKLATVI